MKGLLLFVVVVVEWWWSFSAVTLKLSFFVMNDTNELFSLGERHDGFRVHQQSSSSFRVLGGVK